MRNQGKTGYMMSEFPDDDEAAVFGHTSGGGGGVHGKGEVRAKKAPVALVKRVPFNARTQRQVGEAGNGDSQAASTKTGAASSDAPDPLSAAVCKLSGRSKSFPLFLFFL
jgi:hypothetical protein